MKKITLLLSLVFCFSLNAQVLTENFDALALPAGWSNEYVSATVDWQFGAANQNATVAPRNGAGMAAFWSNNYNGDATRLVTASMDLSGLPSQVLNFYYTQEDWGGDQDQLRVYYKTSAAGAWVEIAAFTADTDPVWTEVNLVLPNPSADYYVAFEGTSGYGRGITIDDVVIDNAPSCLTPGSLSVFATSATTSDLNWVPAGTETDFTYEYGAPGFTVANSEEIGTGSVTANSAPITGLTADTAYEFYVQANCGVDGDSGWAGPFAWTQSDEGDSCGAAYVATLEADCGTATPITLDFTGAPSNISTSCDTFNNYGLWITATTDAAGGLTVNASAAVDMAIYDMCGGTDIQCFGGSIDPSTDVVLSPNTQYYLYFWQEGTASTAMVDICISSYSPAPAPDCAEEPIFPADGAIDIEAIADITLSWTAPSAGPAPTSYNIYSGTTSGALTLLANVAAPTTTYDVPVGAYSTVIYWQVLPVNASTEAAGPCAEWSFTTEDPPPPPANDNACNATMLNIGDASTTANYTNEFATIETGEAGGSCYFGGTPASASVWFSFVAPVSGEVLIATEDTGAGATLDDTQITLYTLANCADLTAGVVEVACDEDDDANIVGDGAGLQANLQVAGLTAGNTYYFVVDGYTTSEGTFDVALSDPTLSVESFENENAFTYFPNPVRNELTLNAQNNIQNVAVYNMLGQEVLRTAPNAIESTIDMNELSQGAYFVKVTIGNVTETIRIIKR
nr:T9SS type A sorting domain-containing protein [uncultured Psychroserpens sp.]